MGNTNIIEITNGNIGFELLTSGDILAIKKDNIQISQYKGNYIDGTVSNIYLRVKEENIYKVTPLIGIKSPSEFAYNDHEAVYKGVFQDIHYALKLTVSNHSWFYTLKLENKADKKRIVDVFYGQDVNLASPNGNEAYISQYIDHQAFLNDNGYVLCSRQNMFQPAYLQIGSMNKTIAYATDGFQFFGKSYKTTSRIEALQKEKLESIVYQYEFSYLSLQTETKVLEDEANFVFYGYYEENHPEAVTEIEYQEEILTDFNKINQTVDFNDFKKVNLLINNDKGINGLDLTTDEVNHLFERRYHEEKENDDLLSFFLENKSHVVLKRKEEMVERPHGHILLNGDLNVIKENVYATTNYMFGVFNSQIVCGNTSFNKMISNTRNPLNLLKINGQRIYVKKDGIYKILSMPSAYEMGLNYSKWYYKLENDLITVSVYTTYQNQQIVLEINAKKQYDFLITNQMVMGENEYQNPVHYQKNGNTVTFKVDEHTFTGNHYKDLTFVIKSEHAFDVISDRVFYEDDVSRDSSLVNLQFKHLNQVTVSILADVNGEIEDSKKSTLESELAKFIDYYKDNLNDFNLELHNKHQSEMDKFNYLVYWYTHDALIHYASPHGLEQYGGAAWGTRDVCQGPFEYFLSNQKFSVCKDILKKVYSHQFIDDGNWPQWFMFDRFSKIQAGESHGDIIVWPLRSLSLYLEATGDMSLLEERLPYINHADKTKTKSSETVLQHVRRQIDNIKENFIKHTYLSCYGDGDWDDTLQPANPDLRKNMVSGWTTALTYETFKLMSDHLSDDYKVLKDEFKVLAEHIKEDYIKYVIKDGVPAGFLLFDGDKIKYIVHPDDKETGVKYRLLPINRSFISGIFKKEEVKHYYDLIKKHLYHPDGVRLMDTTVSYKGGVNTYFKRAEQASNFGREIGLQYVHAHIRFVEAMANIGYKDEVYNGLMRINPIKIKDAVTNAERRQSNSYFSSSDAKFNNRYEAMKNFDLLRTGDIPVKGGWRIYSSGPGIYINQVIRNFLGLRLKKESLVIDPQIPESLDGLVFQTKYMDKIIKIHYTTQLDGDITINGKTVEYTLMGNPYRTGGMMISRHLLKQILTEEINQIYVKI